VTLSIFPGVLAEDAHSAELGEWYPLLLMTLFNFSDLAGKNAPLPALPPAAPLGAAPGGGGGGGRTGRRQRAALAWSAARGAFLPLFLAATRLGAPAAVVALLCAALGGSNGWAGWARARAGGVRGSL
jgi:hypothetical protein